LKITKPIRLIECFAGYGSQALSLKYLGVPFEHWRIAEWAVKSIQAYKDMHFPDDDTDYSKEHSTDWLIEYLFNKGISADYNKPMTKAQITRMGENKIRTVYNNIIATNNLVSVTNVRGEDLNITDTDRYTYILTYSFPCQSLSNAGLREGMAKGSGTRSGLLWEIERILDECTELPQILLMENVPGVIGKENFAHFTEWYGKLESLGYKSWYKVMNAKEHGMPQNRERCFMVSALGDHYYEFPKTVPLELRLKDLLEPDVDEKYYLKTDMIEYFRRHSAEQEAKGNGFRFAPTDADGIAKTILTRPGERMDDNFIKCDQVGIRKLTPRECFRLMGVKDEDFERVAANQSDSSLYHLAGDSIVTNCLMAIFKEML
jgi:DNA (cytosine-5)-methyltransferase 1